MPQSIVPVVPESYRCGKCGLYGVKLWRLYQTFLDGQELTCVRCTEAAEGRPCPLGSGGGDQIGGRVPAVPTPDGASYWGYTSVPDHAVAWWKSLPLCSPSPTMKFDHVFPYLRGMPSLIPPDPK